MKIVDEKGRIFGKINVIDFIIVLCLVFLIPMFYYSYRIIFIYKEPNTEQTKKLNKIIEIMGITYDIASGIVQKIDSGDKELDINGKVIGEIIEVGKLTRVKREIRMGSGNKSIEDKGLVLKLRLKCVIDDESYLLYKNKRLLYGLAFDFNTPEYSLKMFLFDNKGS